jgi:predicted O-methyltransferase YrrM
MRVLTHFALWTLGLAKAETQTSETERAALEEAARERTRLVEIGVWHGVTTTRLRRAMAHSGVLYAVDPFEPGRLGFSMQRLIAKREVSRVRRGQIRWVRLPSVLAAARVLADGPVDFIFIDGDHSYDALAADWGAWSSGIVPGGTIALHDSVSSATRDIEGAGSVRYTRERIAVDPRFRHERTVETLTLWTRRE